MNDPEAFRWTKALEFTNRRRGGGMSRLTERALLIVVLVLAVHAYSQTKPTSNSATASCTFKDGKQITVRYHAAPIVQEGFVRGEPWTPGGAGMFLFTQTDLAFHGSSIPLGAYSLYVIPNKKDWTLVINKNVNENSSYDPNQDLARATMQTGHLGSKEKNVRVMFGHVADKQCNMRIYRADTGGWTEFKER